MGETVEPPTSWRGPGTTCLRCYEPVVEFTSHGIPYLYCETCVVAVQETFQRGKFLG